MASLQRSRREVTTNGQAAFAIGFHWARTRQKARKTKRHMETATRPEPRKQPRVASRQKRIYPSPRIARSVTRRG